MGPYGSVWGDIKTGRSPMAPNHFWTHPDPKMAHKHKKMTTTYKKKIHLFGPLLLSTRGGGPLMASRNMGVVFLRKKKTLAAM